MFSKRRLLLLSNSTLHPTGYLEYAKDHIVRFLTSNGVKKVLFVPYALRDQDSYAATARKPFEEWGFEFESVHQVGGEPAEAVKKANCVFVGGGNTFQLLDRLYETGLISAIRDRVLRDGMPYIGSSAGTNVSTASINTTNDMPIVYPPTFEALGLVPFNINPHFLDADPESTHKGETREERLSQYHKIPGRPPVLALREGSILNVEGDRATLIGNFHARLFIQGEETKEHPPGSDLSFLLN